MNRDLFMGISFFITFLLCSLYSYFIGDVFGIIMAILIVGWLLFFKEEKQERKK